VIVVYDRPGANGRPLEAIRRCCNLQAAVHPPGDGVTLAGDGVSGPPVDDADAELDWAGIPKGSHGPFPMHAVGGFHVVDVRLAHGIARAAAVPDAETARAGVLQDGHIGLEAAVFLAGHDRVGDAGVALRDIDHALHVVRVRDQVIVDEQVRPFGEMNRLRGRRLLAGYIPAGVVM